MGEAVSNLISGVWLAVPLFGYIRITTICTAFLLFLYVIWKFRSRRNPLYEAVVSVIFSLSIYEIVFNAIAAYIFLKTLELFMQHFSLWNYIMVGGWLIMGFMQVKRNFVLTRMSTGLLATCLIAWVVWILIGLPYNVPSTTQLSIPGEFFNIVTKSTFLLGYGFGLQPNKKVESDDGCRISLRQTFFAGFIQIDNFSQTNTSFHHWIQNRLKKYESPRNVSKQGIRPRC